MSSPKEGLPFDRFSQGRSLKRAATGEGLLLDALRVGLEKGSSRGGTATWCTEGGAWRGQGLERAALAECAALGCWGRGLEWGSKLEFPNILDFGGMDGCQ